MTMPKSNDPAPALRGPTPAGTFDLADHRGKPVVVYFYPKDMTPGCTTEARDFRDRHADLLAAGAVVVGVSRDSVRRHAQFQDKEALPFPLVADDDGTITEAWGVWTEKSMYGKAFMGIQRATFLVGPDGHIARTWDKVKVKGHVDDVVEAVKALG